MVDQESGETETDEAMKIVDGWIVGEFEPQRLWPAGAAVGAMMGKLERSPNRYERCDDGTLRPISDLEWNDCDWIDVTVHNQDFGKRIYVRR